MSIVFYDTETTGLLPFFDQILHFAAVRTDENLDHIESFEIRSRLLPHIVPSPGAIGVTRVKVSQLTDPSHPSHYEMVRAIRAKLLAWTPSLFVGWNSIRFDEDLLRQALYKTLHNPYLTNSFGNSRSDVMRIVQACSLFAPDVITLPTGSDGQKIFRLDEVAPANGFDHKHAHTAMGDVEASIFLARIVAEKAPGVWSSFMRFSKKAAVIAFIEDEAVFCLTPFYSGKPYPCFATKIGQNQENPAEWFVYNLSVDPEGLLSMPSEELVKRLSETPKLIRKLKSNAAPILFPLQDALDAGIDPECTSEELERRAEVLRCNAEFRVRILSAYNSQKEEYPPSSHVEMQIYERFFQRPDEVLMEKFHESPWNERHSIVTDFQDPRLQTLGRKLIHLERPGLLSKAMRREHDLAVARRLLGVGENIVWMTLPKALNELEAMLIQPTGSDIEFLQEHEQFLRKRHYDNLAFVGSSE